MFYCAVAVAERDAECAAVLREEGIETVDDWYPTMTAEEKRLFLQELALDASIGILRDWEAHSLYRDDSSTLWDNVSTGLTDIPVAEEETVEEPISPIQRTMISKVKTTREEIKARRMAQRKRHDARIRDKLGRRSTRCGGPSSYREERGPLDIPEVERHWENSDSGSETVAEVD